MFMYKKLGMWNPKKTSRTLQLDNRSIKNPHGVVEDILIRVGDFIFPTNFIIPDIEED